MPRYAIVNKNNILPVRDKIDTKASRYPIGGIVGTVLKRAATRACARQYKKRYKNPLNYNIVDTQTMEVVR